MVNKIIAESDYKKAPRLPVYATFKVLMKQNLFKTAEGNSHKYIFVNDKSSVLSWIEPLQ